MPGRRVRSLVSAVLVLQGLGIAAAELPPGIDLQTEVVIPRATEGREPDGPGSTRPGSDRDGALEFQDLANGLSVVLLPRRGVPSVAVQLWIQAGVADEGPGERGALAILEQVFRLRCEDALIDSPANLRGVLPSLETQITPDALRISLEGPSESLEGMLWALARSVQAPRMDPVRFESARLLAVERARHAGNDGDTLLQAALHSLAFRVHPYRYAVLAGPETISTRSRSEVEAFARRVASPDRSRLVVVGVLNPAQAARTLIRDFGTWERSTRTGTPKIVEPKLLAPRTGLVAIPDPKACLALGFPAPPYRGEDSPAISVLAQALDPASGTVLGRTLLRSLPPGSRVSIRYIPARDPTLLTLSVSGSTFPPEGVLPVLLRLFESVRANGLTEGDLAIAKERLLALAGTRTQGYAAEARALGLTAILSDPEPPLPMLERVLALDVLEVRRAASAYLATDGFVACLAQPVSPTRMEGEERLPRTEPIRLASGAQVVRWEDPGDDPAAATLRFRTAGLPLQAGDLAGLRRRMLRAICKVPGARSWVVDAPLPGLERDALVFSISAPGRDLGRSVASLFRALSEFPFQEEDGHGCDLETANPWQEARDRALDQAAAVVLATGEYSVPAYPAPGSPPPPPDRFEGLRRELVRPDRLLVAIRGDLGPEELAAAFPATATTAPVPLGGSPSEAQEQPRADSLRSLSGSGDALVVLAAKAPGASHPTSGAARLLARILGDGPGSRLGRRLRRTPGAGFEAGSRYLPLAGGPGLVLAWIGCSEASAEVAELLLREEVTRLALETPSIDEIVAAREAARSEELTTMQSSLRASQRLGQRAQRDEPPGPVSLVDALALQDVARGLFSEPRIETYSLELASLAAGKDPARAERERRQ